MFPNELIKEYFKNSKNGKVRNVSIELNKNIFIFYPLVLCRVRDDFKNIFPKKWEGTFL